MQHVLTVLLKGLIVRGDRMAALPVADGVGETSDDLERGMAEQLLVRGTEPVDLARRGGLCDRHSAGRYGDRVTL
jgi:hypothetical protein